MASKSNNKPSPKSPQERGWLARIMHRTGTGDDTFARQAQEALDNEASSPSATAVKAVSKGKMYRAGVTLADLQPGECGTVRKLFGAQQGRLRLLEMGLTPGTHIRMLRAAAVGGPIDILIRNYHLSLRRDEAAGVWLDDSDEEKAEVLALLAAKNGTEQ